MKEKISEVIKLLARNVTDGYIIDTCKVFDYYETAIRYSNSNTKWIVVETYSTCRDAILGHLEWVQYCQEYLPEKLYSVQSNKEEMLGEYDE